MTFPVDNMQGVLRRGDLEQFRKELERDIGAGRIVVPVSNPSPVILAGGTNLVLNSDINFSKMAMAVAGTLPGTAGDTNQEAYRIFRQQVGANIGVAAADALKAVGHSLFAGDENVNPDKPRWDRVNGWVEIGAAGATQYDIAFQLPQKSVNANQRWFVRLRIVALDSTPLPAVLEVFSGVWAKTAASEGWITGSAFSLGHEIIGTPGATNANYRVRARTDSGVEILSNILNVPNLPNVLSDDNYLKLFYNAGPGFIAFEIYKEVGGVYRHVYTVQNTIDFQYNDTGRLGEVVSGWPVVASGANPRAYAETHNVIIPPFGSTWGAVDLTIDIPAAYDFSQTNPDGQFLRVGLTAPTAVSRHVGIDRIWFSTTYNEWAPDKLTPFADGSFPTPSISPTQGNQGIGGGVTEPPPPGSGGPTECVLVNLPVLVRRRRQRVFRHFRDSLLTDEIPGRGRVPQTIIKKRFGTCAEYYRFKTKNGIGYECNGPHQLLLDVDNDISMQAKDVQVGDLIDCWVAGRKTRTTILSKELILEPVEVGTYVLHDPTGKYRDGKGIYIAGRSRRMDRGLYCRNFKRMEQNIF